ncbi:ThuA domain-containing protein [Hymenobacter crusticola]|uniref:ThuA domain-containing protein n=1 Tax=Hymenobacter crusticola TaxID=1770526 RepID=UPI000A3787D7|nr:ThuA domain-containing protein [Hymenobacter crusticola]
MQTGEKARENPLAFKRSAGSWWAGGWRKWLALGLGLASLGGRAPSRQPDFQVIAFFTGKHDLAHISFVREANQWFPRMAAQHHFTYDTTSNWQNMNAEFLKRYQVVVFLDTRPETAAQRAAFQQYMERGGAWLGFHFAAFALSPSTYAQNWDWYHERFLGSGQYVGNTWRPTAAVLQVADQHHPTTRHLPATFTSAPNEWYKWEHDLRQNPDIDVLLAIDPSSFPLGTGPKPHEIWHAGYYPVAWTNRRYRMVYANMGHNDMDYEHGTNQSLSATFSSPAQSRFILNSLRWLGRH